MTPIEVGIVGMGNVSSAYLRTLDDLIGRGVATAGAMCARDQATWPRLRARRPSLRLVATPEEVFASDAAVILILTPPETHAQLTTAALARGRHVVVEKPLAMSAREGREVAAAASRAGATLLCAPFVTLSQTFGQLHALVDGGVIGSVHSARAMYGNLGSDWASWYHSGAVGPLAEVGIYNLQSLTTLLGPVRSVQASGVVGVARRQVGDRVMIAGEPDTVHVMLRHERGAISTVMASHAAAHYRRPAVELYGDLGVAQLLGDDWDPTGIEVWTTEAGTWQLHDPIDPTWHWTDGLREAVMSIVEGRRPRGDLEHDLHLLDVLDAAEVARRTGAAVEVSSQFERPSAPPPHVNAAHRHDHTRPGDEQ